MKLMSMQCPSCGGVIDSAIKSRIVVCEYCGSRFVLDGDGANDFVESIAASFEEEDTSSASMPQFAEEACKEYLCSADADHFESSRKILKGLGIDSDERVFLIHDDTMFKSGKNGFAITEHGLYCRDMGEPNTVFTSWSDLARFDQLELDGCHIQYRDRLLCYFTDDNDMLEPLYNLYKKLHRHARKVAN